ncbi:hypothetical protein QL285_015442 [Trifolium repens]|nr:hypothetical protein QL285_015442 [Trifolium repens]
MKVTIVEEANDISEMKVDELIGSLLTFEVAIKDRLEEKNKSIAFVSKKDESLSEAIVSFGRKFNMVLKRMESAGLDVGYIPLNISNNGSQRNQNETEEPSQVRSVQCNECEGYDHNKSECATYLKKKKGVSIFGSNNDDYKGESVDEVANRVTAFTSKYESSEDSCDEDASYEELASSYRELCVRSAELCKIGEKQQRIIAQLQAEKEELLSTISSLQNKSEKTELLATISELQNEKDEFLTTITGLNSEVSMLTCKLDSMRKSFKLLNNGTDKLDEILQNERDPKDMKGVGCNFRTKQNHNSRKFVPTQESYDSTMSGQMPQHPKHHQRSNTKSKFHVWTCHYCGKKGHIKPFYYKLYGFPKRTVQPRNNYAVKKTMKVWKPKEGSSSLNTKATPITTIPASKISISRNVSFGTNKNNDSPIIDKKPHTMKSLCLDPIINPTIVEPHVHTNGKGFVVSNVETLGQSRKNVPVVESVHSGPLDSLTKIVDSIVGSPKETLYESDVMPDVSTSLTKSSGQKNVSTGATNDMPASVEKDVSVVDQDQVDYDETPMEGGLSEVNVWSLLLL